MSAAMEMDPSELFELRLRQWARYFGERKVRDEHETCASAGLYRSPAAALAVGGQGGAVASAAHAMGVITRDSNGRRTLMGERAGLMDSRGRPKPTPDWSCEPIRATETRGARAPSYAPDDAVLIERAVLDLHRTMPAHGLAIRLHYCAAGYQDDKAGRMDIGRGKFRELVAEARGWLRCRLGS